MSDPVLLVLVQSAVYFFGWLVLAANFREHRPGALALAAFAALGGLSVAWMIESADPVPGLASRCLALVAVAIGNFGADHFANRRVAHRRLWLGILFFGCAVQAAVRGLPDLPLHEELAFSASLNLFLVATVVVLTRPILREYGRNGLAAIASVALYGAFGVYTLLDLLLVPGAAAETARQWREHAASPVPFAVGSGLFHLAWITLVITHQSQRLRRLARYDDLTGLLRRQAAEQELAAALALAQRTGLPLAIAFIDVDTFKSINDAAGHKAGDEVLRRLAQVLREAMRTTDSAGRWGGDEIVLVMPNTDSPGAHAFVQRLQGAFGAAGIPLPGGQVLTVSVGLAISRGRSETVDELVSRADTAMYRAKSQGRNRVVEATAATAVAPALRAASN